MSKAPWNTNADARIVPTKMEFLLNRTLYSELNDILYCIVLFWTFKALGVANCEAVGR